MSFLFFVYIAIMLWIAIFNRFPAKREFIAELFWGLGIYFTYGWVGLRAILQYVMNILFFIPFGVLFPRKNKGVIFLAVTSALFSVSIEILQFIFCLGVSEIDDVVANILGAIIGWLMYVLLKNINKFWKDSIKYV